MKDASIYENIAFNAHIDEKAKKRIQQICEDIDLHKEIIKFEHAYGTIIGEQGASISLGQRQRLLIARALYSQSKFLIFDEMSNALDKSNTDLILKYISSLPP